MNRIELGKIGGRKLHYALPIRDRVLSGIVNATVTIQLRRANGDLFDWDIAEREFKPTGHVQSALVVPFVSGCTYSITQSLARPDGTVDMTDGQVVQVEGTCAFVGGPTVPLDIEYYECGQWLAAGIASGDGGRQIVRAGGASLLRIFAADGDTVAQEHVVADYAGAPLDVTGSANVPEVVGPAL